MSEVVTDLSEAREARRMTELMSQLDEALKGAMIDITDPADALGRVFAIIKYQIEHTDADRREHRAWLVQYSADMEDRQLRHMEESRQVVAECHTTAQIELSKLDLMARKAEANNKRLELTLEENATALIKRLASDLTAAVKHGSVLRAKAYNRDRYLYAVSAGVVIVMLLLGTGYVTGRMTAPSPVADNQSQEESR